MARRTKRLWTDEEKRSICFQTTAGGVSVAQVARRYAMNANMVFKWLRDPRYAPEREAVEDQALLRPALCRSRSSIGPGTRIHLRAMTPSPRKGRLRSTLRAVTACGSSVVMIPRLWRG